MVTTVTDILGSLFWFNFDFLYNLCLRGFLRDLRWIAILVFDAKFLKNKIRVYYKTALLPAMTNLPSKAPLVAFSAFR